MDELIDRNDVYKLLQKNGIAHIHVTDIDRIKTVDSVPVVLCKDCKFYGGATFNGRCKKLSGIYTTVYMTPKDFCSFAERKDSEADV